MAALNDDERMEFLTHARIGIISLEWRDRAPLSVPVWYDYELGGDVRVWTFADSLKHKLVRAAGRFSLTVQDEQLPYRFVSVQGQVASIEPASRDWVQKLAIRYLGEERGATYIEHEWEPESVTVRMSPQRWLGGKFLYRDRYKDSMNLG